MDVRQLALLRELRDRGSLAAVATALHITPSAVSQQLAGLQRSAGVPLTRRIGRTLALTAAGEALADASVDVLSALTRAREAVDEHRDGLSTIVTVAAFHSAARTWFPPLIAAFADGTPGVRCSDEDVAIPDFPRLTADYDLVIAHRPGRSRPWTRSGVVALPLMYEPLDVAMSTRHRLAGRTSVSAADLASESWIAVHDGFPLAPSLARIEEEVGHSLVIAHRINEFFVARACLAASDCVALMPRVTAASARDDGIVLVPLDGIDVGRSIDVLVRPDVLERRAVRVVVERLQKLASPAAR